MIHDFHNDSQIAKYQMGEYEEAVCEMVQALPGIATTTSKSYFEPKVDSMMSATHLMKLGVIALSSTLKDLTTMCWAAFEGCFETYKRMSANDKLLQCAEDIGVRTASVGYFSLFRVRIRIAALFSFFFQVAMDGHLKPRLWSEEKMKLRCRCVHGPYASVLSA